MSKTRSKRLRLALFVWCVFIAIATINVNISATWGKMPSPSIENEQADTVPESEFEQEFQVSPQDPGYLAIKSLIKRYGCMSPYPDGHLGPRVELIRSELVVDLNACLESANQMVAARLSEFALKQQISCVKSRFDRMADEIQRLKRKKYGSN